MSSVRKASISLATFKVGNQAHTKASQRAMAAIYLAIAR